MGDHESACAEGEERALLVLHERIVHLDHAGVALLLPATARDRWLWVGALGFGLLGYAMLGLPGLVALSALAGALFWWVRRVASRVPLACDGRALTWRWGLGPPTRLALAEVSGIEQRPGIGLRLSLRRGEQLDLFLPGLADRELAAVEQLVKQAVARRLPERGTSEEIPRELAARSWLTRAR